MNPALNLDQAHLTELSEEQAKYMGLSKTGRFLNEMAGFDLVIQFQVPSNQTTIVTNEEQMVFGRCSTYEKAANPGR